MGRVHLLSWARGYRRSWLVADIWAGVTIAAITIPEDMGYARIAGMPVQAGLYCALLPLLVYVLLGSSRQLNVGADSATAAVIGSGAALVATSGTDSYLAAVAIIALANGIILVVAGLAGLGFLANLMAKSVLVGFLAGVGIQIAVGQLPDILGVGASGSFFQKVRDIVVGLPGVNLTDLYLATGVIIVVVICQWLSSRLPAMLIGLIGAMIAVEALSLKDSGIELVGSVPAGLPGLSVPDITQFSVNDLFSLCGTALAVSFVVLAQAAATSRSFAAKNGYDVDVSTDLVGLGGANLAAGVTGAFPVNGSVSRTAAMDGAGGRTQVASLVSLICIAMVLLFATDLLAVVPEAALGAIILLAVVRLINVQEIRAIWRSERRWAKFLVVTTTVSVCVLGVKTGIVAAIMLSLLEGLVSVYRPADYVLAQDDDEGGWAEEAYPGPGQSLPGVIAYGAVGSLRFYNFEYCRDRLLALVRSAGEPVHTVVFVMNSSADVDYSAGIALKELVVDLQARQIRVLFAGVATALLPDLEHYGITELVGTAAYHHSVHGALEAAANPRRAAEKDQQ